MRRYFFPICSLLAILVACVPATVSPLPSPTLTLPTESATPSATPPFEPVVSSQTPEILSPTPTEGASPTPEPDFIESPLPLPTLSPPPTLAATDTPQPAIGSGAIQIFNPGPLSKVVSPIQIYGYIVSGYGNNGLVELFGEDGRLLTSQVLQLNTIYKWASFSWDLSFDIKSAAELGRLTFSTQDQYGRVTAVYSIHLLLLQEGNSIINLPGNQKARCILDQPIEGRSLSGGVLTVAGKMRPFNNLPLTVELIARDGSVIGSQLVAISPASDDSHVPFRVDIPYSVSKGTWALLVVRQSDERIRGTMYLYSQEVFFNP